MSSALRQLRATTKAVATHPANRGHTVRALTRLVLFQLWERVMRRPLPVRFHGLTLLCFPHQPSSSGVVYNRMPEWEEMHFVRAFLRRGDVFVDVGANVGVYTLLAASIESVCVEAFEPSSATYECLAANVERNALHGRVRLHRAAVGATQGAGTLTTNRKTMNRLDDAAPGGEAVKVVSLDAVLSTPPALVKIDVEGFELPVLIGLEGLMATHPPALLIENNDPAELGAWFNAHRYTPCRYDVDTNRLTPTELSDVVNVIAVRDIGGANDRLRDQY